MEEGSVFAQHSRLHWRRLTEGHQAFPGSWRVFDRVSDTLPKGWRVTVGGMGHLDPLLSVRDLAEYLRLPIGTLYAWRYRGQGPSGFRVGRHIRYRQSDIDGWIQQQVAAEGSDPIGMQERRAAP